MRELSTIIGSARTATEEAQQLANLSRVQEYILVPQQDRTAPPVEISTRSAALAKLIAAKQHIDEAIERLGA